jgi:hypothetical protein
MRKKLVAAYLVPALMLGLGSQAMASISIILNLGLVNGGNWTSGAVWLVSIPSAGTFSTPFTNGGTSMAGTGNTYIGGLKITSSNNSSGGAQGSIAVPFTINYGTGITAGSKLAAVYVSTSGSNVDSWFNLSTGSLNSGYSFSTTGSGTLLSFGSYAGGATPETVGGALDPTMGWVLPADSGASSVNLSAWTVDEPYIVSNDLTLDVPLASGTLDTTGSVGVVPEPSTGALMMIGAAGLVALRRLRKV